ncbi:adenosylcobinamide-GDP ribazoletransferase [Lentisphaera profundi]|uniref:Adenosylcobinamide-GDP ribazoletransferase n=1 Tax=Lentisphaera profundi TaxID=1658616 RepID=A0ABY7VSE8_9BACT|nr:adenosylcobinamide-GDP ribazoletransferase [Lentisphaera profundi]WDE97130.1 adenosylcobinamide-GDP ribazoletransferase [Lentisphaera profundi]
MFKSFLMALSTLTCLPIPYRLYENADAKRSAAFYPLIGLVLGLVVAGFALLLNELFSAKFNALIILFLTQAISKAFHLDGLADCADAFWSSRSKERKLEIMKDSHIGVMGALAIVFILLAKYVFY